MTLSTTRRPRRYSRSRAARGGAFSITGVSSNVLPVPTTGTTPPPTNTETPSDTTPPPAGGANSNVTASPAAGYSGTSTTPPWSGYTYRGTDPATNEQIWLAPNGQETRIPPAAGWPVPAQTQAQGIAGLPPGTVLGSDAAGNPLVVGADGKASIAQGGVVPGSPGPQATVSNVKQTIASAPTQGDLVPFVAPAPTPGGGATAVDPRLAQTPQGPTPASRVPTLGAQDALIASGRVPRAWSDGVAIFDHGGTLPEDIEGIGLHSYKMYRFERRQVIEPLAGATTNTPETSAPLPDSPARKAK